MLYIDKLGLCFDKNANDIHFKKIFIDKIISHFFPDKNDKFLFIEIGSLHGRDTLDVKNMYKNSICHCIEGLKPNFDKYLFNFEELYGITPHNICIASYEIRI